MQACFNSKRGQRVIRSFGNKSDFLAYRQANGAYQRQLLFGKVISRHNQLLLPVLEFHLGAKSVNGRTQARVLLVGGLAIECLRGLQLRFGGFYPRSAASA